MDEIEEAFGVTEEERTKSKDIIPTLQMAKWFKDNPDKPLEIEFNEDKPRDIEITNKEGNKETRKAITVQCLGVEYTLWLSAKSLRIPIANMYVENTGLKGLKAVVTKRTGTHPKWGEVEYYNLQQIKSEM